MFAAIVLSEALARTARNMHVFVTYEYAPVVLCIHHRQSEALLIISTNTATSVVL